MDPFSCYLDEYFWARTAAITVLYGERKETPKCLVWTTIVFTRGDVSAPESLSLLA